jgi:hypothetical protein
MTRVDARGNPVSTRSSAALAAAERALWRMMSFYGTPIDDLAAAAAADPAWLLPGLMKAGFLLSLTEPALAREAIALLDGMARAPAAANARERAHLAALQRVAAGDWQGGAEAWGEIALEHPRDALALHWAHQFDFHRGDAVQLHRRVDQALPAWHQDDPLHPYVLALKAFGLEESGRYDEAEATGRQALAGGARVPWAIHAVAHVMEMQGRHAEGACWMGQWRRHWAGDEGSGEARNGFAGHLGWHEAVFALESLDSDTALRVFDTYLDPAHVEITLQRVDAASLLWRLHLLGVDVGDRWRALVAAWPLDDDSAGHSVFNDAHATMALIGAGETPRARAWAAQSLERARRAGGWNGAVARDLGAAWLRGRLAFGDGRDGDAAAAMALIRAALARVGGSHAQRDVLTQTLVVAAARGGRHGAGRALVEDRVRRRGETPLAARWATLFPVSARG